MPLYEHVFIARQDISTQQVEGLVEHFSEIIKENGGSVEKTEYWGLRSLAYRIKKNRKGHYVLLNLDTPFPALQEMERQQRLNDDIIRSLTVRVDELEEGPSAVVRAKQSRDRGDRPRRDFRRDKPAPESAKPQGEAPKSQGDDQ